jgi:uncharacterized membrane protein SpoIIM required for sporulation
MKQSLFEARHQAAWQRFEQLLKALEQGKATAKACTGFAADYRQLCQQLALARERGYSSHLIDRLQHLALAGHQQLYRHRSQIGAQTLGFVLAGFPQLIRREWRSVLVASVLFYGSLIGMGLLVYCFPDLIDSLLAPEQVSQMEAMYDPEVRRIGRFGERDAGDDWMMFGYYIMNNIGIGFQTFASGLLFGVGTLFFLMFNGLTIGAVAGYLTQIGYSQTFWSFVSGHGAFELTAITFAGAAGLKLGAALLAPGRLTRAAALRQAAALGVQLVAGVLILLLIAAFVEAYWSSNAAISPAVKYAVAAVLWLLLAAYFLFAGRRAHAPD